MGRKTQRSRILESDSEADESEIECENDDADVEKGRSGSRTQSRT